jgi:hypothetical protein
MSGDSDFEKRGYSEGEVAATALPTPRSRLAPALIGW